jgi:hypothetical protein
MITGDINNFGVFCNQSGQMTDHLQMGLWEESFPELPDIDDITIQNKHFGLNAFQVLQ